ncbi:MAG: CinA family protein [Proteobacteria bacterium]|nr:CinA family protein [Pseudomonadota bacterium]
MFTEIAGEIAALLIERNETVAVAESTTGGLIMANLLSVPGASAYFQGGSVVYTLASRRAFLDLEAERLRGLEPLTEPMVAEFARAARLKLATTWGIAELGAAGPAGSPYGHDAGTSVIAVAGPNPRTCTVLTHVNDRPANMQAFAGAALRLFRDALLQTSL